MGVGPARRMAVVFFVAVVTGVSFALPAMGAEDAAVFLEGGLPVRVAGGFNLEAEGGSVLSSGRAGELTWQMHADSLQVRLVETWSEEAEGDPSRPAVFTGTRVSESSFTDVTLQVKRRLPMFQSIVWTDSGDVRLHVEEGSVPAAPVTEAAWRVDPDVRVDRLSAPVTVENPVPRSSVQGSRVLAQEGFSYTVPEGRLMVTPKDAQVSVHKDVSGYLFGAQVSVRSPEDSRSFTLSRSVEERDGRVYLLGSGWTGPGTHEEEVVRYLEFRAEGADWVLEAREAPDLRLHVPSLDFGLSGHLTVPQAEGWLLFAGDPSREVWRPELETVVVSGRVAGSMVLVAREDRMGVTGTGDLEYVAAGVHEARPVRAFAGVAGAMVLVAGVVTAVQWLASSPGVSLFSRMDASKVLAHPLRSRIYASVRRRPGVSPQMLARQEEAGWSTIIYHLRVLERHGFVCGVRDGRHRRYFDSTTGRWSNGRKDVLAVLLNPSTARVACLVRGEPGVAQRSVADRLDLAPSSVNWHVRRLTQVGLVSRVRGEGKIRLHPGAAWESVTEAGALPLVQAVAAGEQEPALEDEEGPRAPRSRRAGSAESGPDSPVSSEGPSDPQGNAL